MKAKQRAGRWLTTGLSLLLLSASAWADSLDTERLQYAEIKQAWDNGQLDKVRTMMPALRDYPLYPYLEYRQLTDTLNTATPEAIGQYLAAYPNLPVNGVLKTRFIKELARRQDWAGVLSFSPQPPASAEAKCDYYLALWQTGKEDAARAAIQTIWLTGRNLPASCAPLFIAWREAGGLNTSLIEDRIRLALMQGNTTLVTTLVSQLPSSEQTMGKGLLLLQSKPETVLDFARQNPVTPLTLEAVNRAFVLIARKDPDNARLLIPVLAQAQKRDATQVMMLKESVVWQLMGNAVTPQQAAWRDEVINQSGSVSLTERRVRLALGTGDGQGVTTWLARLPADVREKDEWRYWQADRLLASGQDKEGKAILRALTQQRGFYPMVAAQRLGERYTLRIDDAGRPSPVLTEGPVMARIHELMYWHLDNLARSEWAALLRDRSQIEQAGMARYAFENDWWDLSVQATIIGKLWDHLEERFPQAYLSLFNRYLAGKSISPSFAMAIARQESAWNPVVRSPVGATGLMQIMPATATHTVKMFRIPGYSNAAQLLDPQVNINIGTSYLQSVFDQFENNRIFAAAAYNAGPQRMKSWLNNSDGRVDAVAFIESIPFAETRGYVKNVLAYDAYYRYFSGKPYPILTAGEWQRRY